MKTVIGIVGPNGSGKDTAASYIVEKLQFSHYQISDPLRDIAKERGLEPTPENLIQIGIENAEKMGPDFLARLLLKKIADKGLITGMRVPAQVTYLKSASKLILIAITADSHIRFSRALARGRAGEAMTHDDFVAKEKDENYGDHPQRVFECMRMADYTIENNTNSLEDLYAQIDSILEKENLLGTEDDSESEDTEI